jgi:hypothetical protein
MTVERWILYDGSTYIAGVTEYGAARFTLQLARALSWPTKQAATRYRSQFRIKDYKVTKVEYPPHRRPHAQIPSGALLLSDVSTYLLNPRMVTTGVERRAASN